MKKWRKIYVNVAVSLPVAVARLADSEKFL